MFGSSLSRKIDCKDKVTILVLSGANVDASVLAQAANIESPF